MMPTLWTFCTPIPEKLWASALGSSSPSGTLTSTPMVVKCSPAALWGTSCQWLEVSSSRAPLACTQSQLLTRLKIQIFFIWVSPPNDQLTAIVAQVIFSHCGLNLLPPSLLLSSRLHGGDEVRARAGRALVCGLLDEQGPHELRLPVHRPRSLQEGHLPQLPQEPLQQHRLQHQEDAQEAQQQNVPEDAC